LDYEYLFGNELESSSYKVNIEPQRHKMDVEINIEAEKFKILAGYFRNADKGLQSSLLD
jgi:hypothetical protein